MPVSETRIAARDKQGVEVYYQHSTIPTAENLAAYERHCPGAAGIMLQMAQDDQKEQWRLSHSESTKRFIMRLVGLCIAAVICLSLVICGTYLIAHGYQITGFVSVLLSLVTLIGSIANGKSSK